MASAALAAARVVIELVGARVLVGLLGAAVALLAGFLALGAFLGAMVVLVRVFDVFLSWGMWKWGGVRWEKV